MPRSDGYNAKQPLPENPVPLGGAVIPPKPQPQRVEVRSEVVEQSIELTPDGRYILVAQANDGFTWQVDATNSVHAAAVHHSETEVAALKTRIQELEQDNARAYEWLAWYAEKYGVPDS